MDTRQFFVPGRCPRPFQRPRNGARNWNPTGSRSSSATAGRSPSRPTSSGSAIGRVCPRDGTTVFPASSPRARQFPRERHPKPCCSRCRDLPGTHGRLGRPQPIDAYLDQGRRRFPEPDLDGQGHPGSGRAEPGGTGQERPLRGPRACHGSHCHGHGPARRHHPLCFHVPHVLRLYAARNPPRVPHAAPGSSTSSPTTASAWARTDPLTSPWSTSWACGASRTSRSSGLPTP